MEQKRHKIRAYLYFILTGFLFVFLCVAERDLYSGGNIVWSPGYLCRILAVSLAGGVVLGSIVCRGIYFWEEHRNVSDRFRIKINENLLWAGAFGLNVLTWSVAYFAYFPGILAYDCPVQFGMIYDHFMNDHHPIAHTLLLKLAVQIGEKLWQSANAGAAVASGMQLLFLAFAFAYGVKTLYGSGVSHLWVLITQVFSMFYCFHLYMSVSVTKDTYFTAFFVITTANLFSVIRDKSDSRKIGKKDFGFLAGLTGCILFRNNYLYALVFFCIVLIFVMIFEKRNRRKWGRILGVAAAAVVLGISCSKIMFHATGAQQGDRREALSLPIQQLARVMVYHGGSGIVLQDDGGLDEESRNLINEFILNEAYRLYDPYFADPVKRNVNTYVARYRASDFVKTYLKLFLRYPGDYLNAFLAVNAGYLSPFDLSHAQILKGEGLPQKGYVQTYWHEEDLSERGFFKDSFWPQMYEYLEKWADENRYLNYPVIKYLFVPGSFLWFYLLTAGAAFIRRDYRKLVVLVLILGYFGTMFLGPVVQMRYLFPISAVFPLAALIKTDEVG